MENTNLKPIVRFPEFTEGWEEKKLGDVTKFKSGGTPSKDEPSYWNGNIPWISAASMKGKYYSNSDRKITDIGLKNGSKISSKGNLLLLVRGSMLYNKIPLGITKVDVAFNQDLKSISTTEATTPSFLYEWFLFSQNKLLNIVVGTGIGAGKLDTNDLKNLRLNLPSLPEQQKITTFLTEVDNHITLLEEKKEGLEAYKKGVMQKIFNQDIRFKDDSGNEFKDWDEKKLGIVGNTINGLTGKTKEDFGSGKPFIQYTQIFNSSKVNTNDFGLVNIRENDNQTKVQFGDILFTTSSETPHEVGMSSVLLEEIDELYLNSFSFGFRPNNLKELVPSFAQYLFRSNNVRRNIIKLAQGSTRYNMSKLSFIKQTILLPEEGEQIKIANYLTVLDDKIEALQQKIESSVDFKKGILQKMFV